MALSEIKVGLSEQIFRPSSIAQAVGMAEVSGIPLSKQQIALYATNREDTHISLSDQQLLAEVLDITGGPSDKFRAAFPNIFNH